MKRPIERPGQKSSARTRDPARTQQRILEAAMAEFSAKGLAGARVDSIARRAGINKRMLYHYFGNKHELFSSVLREKIAQREALLAAAPDNPADLLLHWFEAACQDPDWFRLLEWEALQSLAGPPVHEETRRAVLHKAVQYIRDRQGRGLLPAGLDAEQLLLSMLALTAYPFAFPQLTRLVTGESVFAPEFQNKRRQFLAEFANLLCDCSAKISEPEPRHLP